MLKVLRKYNKLILVVGGTLLLIAFLIPQAIQQLGKARMGQAIGSMDGRKVTLATYEQSRKELAALREFFSHLDREIPIKLESGNEIEHWMLLTREAEQAGMVGGSREGASLLPVLAQALVQSVFRSQYGQFADYFMQSQPDAVQEMAGRAQQLMAESRYRAAGATRMTFDEFDSTLARLRGVSRMLDDYRTAERLSDQETRILAKSLAESALVDSVFLSARALADESLEPTPEELEAHFQRFRELRQGEGEFGIGYRLPPRVKIEWIELSRPAIEASIEISLLDATKHWTLNRARFPGEFAEEREKVEAELRTAKTSEIMEAAEGAIRSEFAKSTRSLEKSGGYRVLPADWASRRPDYMKVADAVVSNVRDSLGVTIPTPAVYIKDATWLDGSLLSEQSGIGAGTVRFGQQSFTFPQVALSVRELAGESVLGLQTGVPAIDLPAQGRDGSRYFYTVLDSAPESIPISIDEVLDRDRMIEDWRALKRYEALSASTEEFAARVASEGIEEFAKSFGVVEPAAPAEEGQTPPEPAQKVVVAKNGRVLEDRTSGLAGAESNETVIAQIRARANQIDPLTPIDSVPVSERVVAVRVPVSLGVLVAQVNGVQPLTNETLPLYADYATRMHWQETFQGVSLPFPFRFDALKERHGLVMKDRKDGGERDESPAPADAEPAESDSAG